MKTRGIAALIALAGAASIAQADLIISEIVDATLTGGLPKFVELTNTGAAPIDLSGYSIGNYNNSQLTLGGGSSTLLSGILAPGDSYVISYEASDSPGVGTFFSVYGFDPDNFSQSAFINGDDVVALFLADGTGVGGAATADGSDATLVDIYGVVGTGVGTVWEYLDGYSFRSFNSVTANPTFAPGEWTFGGVDSLDDASNDPVIERALILANTTPGTHSFVPTPGAAALLAMGGLVALRRRK